MRHWLLLGTLAWTLFTAQGIAVGEDLYVYAYFKGGWPTGGHSGVFLDSSTDGLNFEPMNDGDAVFVPPESWGNDIDTDDEDQTRDPSVVYGPDGLYHMVWTSGITTRSIGYASSSNLRDWTAELVDVWNPSVNVNHTWAPEILYNDSLGLYQIVFASDLDGGDHKLYSITTNDFSSYTEPEVFYYNGNTVIDGMIAKDVVNGQYIMAIKDERGGAKNISIATSTDASPMSWTTNNPVVVGTGSNIEPYNSVEGPSLLKIDDTWLIYYDVYGPGYLGVAVTDPNADPTDPNSWVNMTSQATLPSDPSSVVHHGTAFAAPADTIAFSLLTYGRSDLNGDDAIDLDDWLLFSDYHLTDLSGLSEAEQAARGDLNGDGQNNFYDFRLFKEDYETFYGAGTFATMVASLQVPEPGSFAMLATLLAGLGTFGRRFRH